MARKKLAKKKVRRPQLKKYITVLISTSRLVKTDVPYKYRVIAQRYRIRSANLKNYERDPRFKEEVLRKHVFFKTPLGFVRETEFSKKGHQTIAHPSSRFRIKVAESEIKDFTYRFVKRPQHFQVVAIPKFPAGDNIRLHATFSSLVSKAQRATGRGLYQVKAGGLMMNGDPRDSDSAVPFDDFAVSGQLRQEPAVSISECIQSLDDAATTGESGDFLLVRWIGVHTVKPRQVLDKEEYARAMIRAKTAR